MGNQTTIEINGKKYDAVTGKLLPTADVPAKPVVINPQHSTGVMDGFVKKPTHHQTKQRTKAEHAVKTPQKSQTLMRKSVHKPETLTPKQVLAHQEIRHRLGLSQQRLRHAQEVKKSPSIHKYDHSVSHSTVVKKHADLKVQSPPTQNVASVKRVSHQKVNHAPASHHAEAHASHNTTGRSKAAEKLIEAALTNAQSHTEPHHKAPKKRSKIIRKLGISSRAAAMSSAVLAGVLLGGFFAVQNVPNLAMRVASTRAGFDAEMPEYQPAGFSFKGPINYSSGQVTVSFKSNTDSREYNFVQRSSNWNSDALLANYVIAEGKQYQTYLDRGRTLYIYDGSNATWVDNGIWYQVEGDSSMTTDQLIRIASSI